LTSPEQTRALLESWGKRTAIGALVFGLCVVAGAVIDATAFFRAWLYSYLFILAFPLGSLAILMLHHLTGGAWGKAIRPVLVAAARTLPIVALLFLPVVFGLEREYAWAIEGAADHDHLLAHKRPWLNPTAFVVRAAIYLAIWVAFSLLLPRLMRAAEESSDPIVRRRPVMLSGPGLLILCLLLSFAGIDWAMSTEPQWYSTIYGLIFVVGYGLTGFAFSAYVATKLFDKPPFAAEISLARLHDLGKLTFAFVMLWAYVQFSQLLIIWSGNLAEESPWYLNRISSGWEQVSWALAAFHFALPWLLLLPRTFNRNPRILAAAVSILLLMRLVEAYWLVFPAYHPTGIAPHWLDVVTPVFLAALWASAFIHRLRTGPWPAAAPIPVPTAKEAHA